MFVVLDCASEVISRRPQARKEQGSAEDEAGITEKSTSNQGAKVQLLEDKGSTPPPHPPISAPPSAPDNPALLAKGLPPPPPVVATAPTAFLPPPLQQQQPGYFLLYPPHLAAAAASLFPGAGHQEQNPPTQAFVTPSFVQQNFNNNRQA